MNADIDLEKLFEELRAEESRFIPRFDPTLRNRPRAVPGVRLVAASALLILLAALAALINVRREKTMFTESDHAVVRSVASWRPPTAFLLRTPGSEMLATTPAILETNVVPLTKGALR